MIATNAEDEERATRINGYADAMAAAAPALVNATKASLGAFGILSTPLLLPSFICLHSQKVINF